MPSVLTTVGVLLSMLQVLQDKTNYYIIMEQCTGEQSRKRCCSKWHCFVYKSWLLGSSRW
jgi:hypothetical protein